MVSRPSNKGLEQTGSAPRNGLGGPCSSIQCSTGAGTWLPPEGKP